MRSSLRLYDQYSYDYATLYRSQPNVRTCVDFLARNIAQLGLHVYRRVSESDRRREREHGLAQTLARPLPPWAKVTTYRLIESLMGDLGIYHNAYWLKVRPKDAPMGLLRVPPTLVTVKGSLAPTGYEINAGAKPVQVPPEAMVHFRGYNAESPLVGLSPLETLRRVLAEEQAAGDYRENFWANAARMHGIVERPADAKEWDRDAMERFKAEFSALYSGPENSGTTAVLEEGMTWKQVEFNAQESEYLAGRKLTREECARAYHIPPPLVGILDHATFANIREQHKSLYTDTLGPWLAMIEQEIALQLLPDYPDSDGVYVEFNIQEKLQGDFEEQTRALQSAVGRPWMTANEARARMNMPSLDGDAGELVTPLNVLTGGQASPRDSAPPSAGTGDKALVKADPSADLGMTERKADGELDATLPRTRERHERAWREALVRHFRRQRAAILQRMGTASDIAGVWHDPARWNQELADDLYALNTATATVWARWIADTLGMELDEERMLKWLQENARVSAEHINGSTQAQVADALVEAEAIAAVEAVFDSAIDVRAATIAMSKVTTAANFGAQEAAKQSGLRTKTWVVNSHNPRSAHALMSGETVPIGARFSNGMNWPGDPAGGADNNSNCQCSVSFGR
jgi:HK97 family phage portal protein